jgi:choline monooxygenase
MDTSLSTLLASYDDSAPLERASTIPGSWYFDERVADLEAKGVFGANWIMVARGDQVAKPGQFCTMELAGEPLVLVRGADGVLRAFYNVCRHHAAAVVTVAEGNANQFRCPYHGWTYGTDGSLKGAPEFQDVCDFDPRHHGLAPVRVAEWEQFCFVNLDLTAEPLPQWLGDLRAQIGELDLGSLKFFERREYVLNCNWKVFVDNYLDGGYHVPHLHKGLNSVLEYKHYTIENGQNYCLQKSPMRAPSDADTAMAETRRGAWALYYWVYPNFMLNWYEGVLDTNLVLPVGIDRTRVIFDFYFAAGSDAVYNRQSVEVSDRIQKEDLDICESVQRGLRSRAYNAGRLSVRREAGEQLFHRLLAADLRRVYGQATRAASL